MKIKHCIIIFLIVLTNSVHGMNEAVAYHFPWSSFVSATPTNLVLKFHSYGSRAWLIGQDIDRLLEYDEEFMLFSNQEMKLTDGRHIRIIFTPASFQNQLNGFRVMAKYDDRRGGWPTVYLAYIALSDTPIEMSEEDVLMIMENGEWVEVKAEEKENTIQEQPPAPTIEALAEAEIPPEVVLEPLPIAEEPATEEIALQNESEENLLSAEETLPTSSNRFWLYGIALLLILLATPYFVRKKK